MFGLTEVVTVPLSLTALITAIGSVGVALYKTSREPNPNDNHDIAVKALKMAERATNRQGAIEATLIECLAKHEECKEELVKLDRKLSKRMVGNESARDITERER